MNHHPRPIDRPFWSPGVLVMLAFMIAGGAALAVRIVYGLGYATMTSSGAP
jgi:hypothetical protein